MSFRILFALLVVSPYLPAQNVIRLPGCEPAALQVVGRVNDAGHYLYYDWLQLDRPGMDLGCGLTDGALDGARVRLYRPHPQRGLEPAGTGTVGLLRGGHGWVVDQVPAKAVAADGQAPFDASRGAILLREDWVGPQVGDLAIIDALLWDLPLPWRHDEAASMALLPHAGPTHPDRGGLGFLRLHLDGDQARCWQAGLERDAGSIRGELLLRADRPGRAQLFWNGVQLADVAVDQQWQAVPFRCQLTAGEHGLGLAVSGVGHLDIDAIAGTDTATAQPAPFGDLRMPTLLSNLPGCARNPTDGSCVDVVTPLGDDWLPLNPFHSLQDWWLLLDHLADTDTRSYIIDLCPADAARLLEAQAYAHMVRRHLEQHPAWSPDRFRFLLTGAPL